jgi:alkanesulfonate monooxygenase SsuD/methylene tetrahydromethanopterin reductase-like flavin-dependent oxidoreductase (luciferase family)
MTNAWTRPAHPWVVGGAADVRFGMFRSPVPDPQLMRREVRYLEDLGFDGIFLPDHPAMYADPWVTLASVADATTNLRLGAVSCVAYRHPAMLARVVADVDRISGGRAILALGSGDVPWEFGMLGKTYGAVRSRRALLEQVLQVMPSLLRGEPVTAKTDSFELHNTVLPMVAVQEPAVPILVAGGSRGTLQLVAQHADACNIGPASWAGGAYTSADITDRFDLLDGFCATSGRTPDSVLRTGIFGLSVAPTADEALAAVEAIPADFRSFLGAFFFAGTPQDTARYLDALVDSGFRYLIFFMADLVSGSRAMTDRLVSEVLPRLGGLVAAQ